MTAGPPTNPYQSPRADAADAVPWGPPRAEYLRQRRTLGWAWLLMGGVLSWSILPGLLGQPPVAAGIAAALFSLTWVICGLGTLLRRRAFWVRNGLWTNYALIAFIVGFVVYQIIAGVPPTDFATDYYRSLAAQSLLVSIPAVMLRQAHRVIRWSKHFAPPA
jgi:hypothetical protein